MECNACRARVETPRLSCVCGEFIVCSTGCGQSSESNLHLLSCGHESPELVAAVFEASGSASAPDSSTAGKVTTLRRLLTAKITKRQRSTRLEAVREAFEAVFPINEYPFKVMGFNRSTGRPIALNSERSLALATMFPHQQLVRDCRAPYISDEGAIIIAPPGAGKTVMCHAILANYSRQLIRIRTPFDYYLNPERSKSKAKSFESDEYQHRILIYVTKANLVGDVAKDVWAQNARSRELFERMMNDARAKDKTRATQNSFRYSDSVNGKYTFARFDRRVHVMSFRKFGNMLLGTNKEGRNLWTGRNLDDADYLQPVSLGPGVKYAGKTVVPVAYWKDENDNYVRGNRPHNFMQALIDKEYNLSVRVPLKAALPTTMLNQLRPALVELLLRVVNSNPLFKRAGAVGVPPLENASFTLSNKPFSSDTGTKKRPSNTVLFTATTSKLQWTANLLAKITDKQWEQFVGSTELQEAILGLLRGYPVIPRNSVEVHSVFQVFPEADSSKRGWVLEREGAKNYRWVPSATGDYELFNPIDRIVAVFDEGHLLFSPDNLLKAEESFDSRLIIQAFRESNGVAYYASATVDVITGIRMGQSLTPLPSYRGASEERRRDDDVFPDYEGDAESFMDAVEDNLEKLGAAMAGKINIVNVSGMRDLFPDKIISEEMNIRYEINSEHSRLIRDNLGESVGRLMSMINLPVRLEERHRLYTSLFDPDALLKDLFGPGNVHGFPLGKALLKAMHNVDEGIPLSMLAGRGILCTGLIDDTVTAVAGLMQALGYEWKYLIPKKLSEAELEAKRLLKKGEYLPLALRSVHFDPNGPMKTGHASPEVISELGLEEMIAEPGYSPDGKLIPPMFVVLSNDMLVNRDDQTELTDTASFAKAALASADAYSIPFRIRNQNSLKELGASELLRAEFRGTNRPVLHYFPANEEARARARIQLSQSGGLADLLASGYSEPFFFIETRDDAKKQAYRRVIFHGQPDGALAVDPSSFGRQTLESVATEYTNIKDNFKTDAREMIRQTFNGGLAAMRATNLRYILISRQYGQGIDVFNVNEVFRTEPAPDPATDEQGVGRFARLGSATEQPYPKQEVRYHTLVAVYGKEVRGRDKIRGTSEPLKSVLEPLNGSHEIAAVLRSVDARPLEALKGEMGKSFKPKRSLLPFQAVRVLTENPAVTLRRARLLKDTLENWAVDKNYNKPERETVPDPREKVYSPTNYVLPTEWLRNALRKLAPVAFQPGEDIDDVDWLLDSEHQNAGEQLARQAKFDKLMATLDQDPVLQISRRLALYGQDRVLVVQLQSGEERIDLELPIAQEDVRALGQLSWLVESGVARFDPGFANVSVSTSKPKRARRPKRPIPEADDEAAKRQRPDDDQEVDRMEEELLAYRLPRLIGVASDKRSTVVIDNVHSIGIAMDRVAAPDQEQQSIESAVLGRMQTLCTALNLWGDHGAGTDSEKVASAVYSRLIGATGDGNPFRLRSAVLLLFEHGLLTLSRALDTVARGVFSYPKLYTRELARGERTKFLDRLAVELGQLYQLSFAANSVNSDISSSGEAWSEPLDLIKRSMALDLTDYEQRRSLVKLMHVICCNVHSAVSLVELSKFLERCFTAFRLGDRGQQRKTLLANWLRSLAKLPAEKSFTLVDVFGLMISSLSVSAKKDLELLHIKMVESGNWDVEPATQKSKTQSFDSLLSIKLSGGRFSLPEGTDRTEIFDSLWQAAVLSEETWPIKRWVNRLATELRISTSLALQRFRELALTVTSIARLETGFKALLREAPKPSPSPSYAFTEADELVEETSYGFLEDRPLLYYDSDGPGPAPVFFSPSASKAVWLSGGTEGEIISVTALLIEGLKDHYPQIRLADNASANWLASEPLLARLPDSLRDYFSEFGSRFKQELGDQHSVLALFKASGARVRSIRSVFKYTTIGLGTFVRLANSSLTGLGPLVSLLRRLGAGAVIPQLDVLIPTADYLRDSPYTLAHAVNTLLDTPGLRGYFTELTERVAVVTNLFAADSASVVRLLVGVWQDNPDSPLTELLQLTVPRLAEELGRLVRMSLEALDEGANLEQGEEVIEPVLEDDEDSPVELLSSGDESPIEPEATPRDSGKGDRMQENAPDASEMEAEVRPPEIIILDDEDDYPIVLPTRITIDEKLKAILNL